MDVDRESLVAANPIAAVGDSAHWTQLNSFSDHGGKIIYYHGVSDPWFSAQDTTRYFEQMNADNGGTTSRRSGAGFYLVPGMGHCGGGEATLDRFDLLDPIVNWVEKGVAPEAVTATGRAFPKRSRPLCPFPKHAHYKGRAIRSRRRTSSAARRAESLQRLVVLVAEPDEHCLARSCALP